MSDYPEKPNTRWPESAPIPEASNGASPHLSDELLAAWTANELAGDEYNAVQRHLESCAQCRRATADVQHIQALVMEANYMQPAAPSSLVDSVLAQLPDRSLVEAPLSDYPRYEERQNWELVSRNQRRDIWRRLGALAAALLLIASSALLFTRFSPRFQPGKAAATATSVSLANLPGVWKSVIPAGATIWDVAVVNPADIWVAGSVASAGEVKTVLAHFDGQRWHLSPDVFTNAGLCSISMVSATEGWASGNSDDGGPLMLHFTDGHWRDATASIDTGALRDRKIILTQVRMATATSGWALGQGDQAPQHSTQVLQYIKVGSTYRWEPTESFEGTTLNALSVVSDHEAWMVGQNGLKIIIVRVTITHLNNDPNSSVTNWDSHSWEDLGSGNLTSVSMRSSTDGWAGGSVGEGALFHWDGVQWTQVGFPSIAEQPVSVQGIVATGENAAWVYGELIGSQASYLYSVAKPHWYAYPLRANEDVVSGVAITPSLLLATTRQVTPAGYEMAPALFDIKNGAIIPDS